MPMASACEIGLTRSILSLGTRATTELVPFPAPGMQRARVPAWRRLPPKTGRRCSESGSLPDCETQFFAEFALPDLRVSLVNPHRNESEHNTGLKACATTQAQ